MIKRILVVPVLLAMVSLMGCSGKLPSGNKKPGWDFFVFETSNERTALTIRVEVATSISQSAMQGWADRNAKSYEATYNKPVTINFYRGGRGPEYYLAMYSDEQFMMLR